MNRVSYILRMYTQKGVLVFLGFAFNLLSISGKLEKEKERKERKREKEKEKERDFHYSYFILTKNYIF